MPDWRVGGRWRWIPARIDRSNINGQRSAWKAEHVNPPRALRSIRPGLAYIAVPVVLEQHALYMWGGGSRGSYAMPGDVGNGGWVFLGARALRDHQLLPCEQAVCCLVAVRRQNGKTVGRQTLLR